MIPIPSRSEYIEAPFTASKFTDSVKDAFEFVGFDARQTSDTSLAFDSEYWRAKQTTSNKNLVKESEQLIFAYDEWAEFDHSGNGAYDKFSGAEMFITKNTDNALPFTLINNIQPRPTENDLYFRWKKTGLKSNTQYTVSFWAKGEADVGGNLTVNVGPDQANNRAMYNNKNLGALTQNWVRYSYTVDTGSNTSIQTHLGGWNTWSGQKKVNLASRTEEIEYWSNGGAYFTYNVSPPPIAGNTYGSNPDRMDFYNNNAPVYQTIQLSNPVGKTYTLSLWVKVLNRSADTSVLRINFNGETTQTSTYIDGEIGVWKRYSVTGTINTPGTTSTNVHIWGNSGDNVVVWGLQFEEGSVATTYQPVQTASPLSLMWGGIQLAGFQIEEGAAPTTYAPVRKWFFKETPLSLTGTLNNQRMLMYYNIPAGVGASFISCKSTNIGNSTRTGLSVYMGTHTGVTSDSVNPNLQAPSSWIRANSGIYMWNANINVGTSGDALPVLSTGLRVLMGKGTNYVPMGNVYFLLGHRYNELGDFNYTLSTDIYGIVFKVVEKDDFSGTTNVYGIGMHQKTPGNGRRKFTSVFVKETATGINMVITTPLFNQTATGVAELAGFLIPTLGPKYADTTTTQMRQNPDDSYMGQYVGVVPTREFTQVASLNKNADTFSFVQGGADGFAWALNTNSAFFFKYLQADFVNPPMADDDGSSYIRFGVGNMTNNSDVKAVMWHSHGPLLGDNVYGTGFGNTFRFGSPWYAAIPAISRMPEVLGDNYDNSQTFNNLVFQSYCIGEEHAYVSSRGQLKNFFHTQDTKFAGAEGDLLITEDGSRYFNIQKSIGYDTNTRIAVYVKV